MGELFWFFLGLGFGWGFIPVPDSVAPYVNMVKGFVANLFKLSPPTDTPKPPVPPKDDTKDDTKPTANN